MLILPALETFQDASQLGFRSGSSPRIALLGMVPNAHQGPDHNPYPLEGRSS
jgi:hypothetical protein